MKRVFKPLLSVMALWFLATCIIAQPPTVTWDHFFPGDYKLGNYTANVVKQSPYGGYVFVGTRSMSFQGNGYREVMLMRADHDGSEILNRQTYGGESSDGIPWDQEAYDMTFTQAEDLRYLVTGYRDTTLTGTSTPPGLFLMEISGLGIVYFDTLYYNNNLHHIKGRCIQPAIGGGYIIAGSIREDGSGPEKIMMVQVMKNKTGKYDIMDTPLVKINPVGSNGYASWIRQFEDGYLLGGNAINGDNKFDLFLQKVGEDRYEEWTRFYGAADNDEFAGAVIYGEHIYLAGSSKVPVGAYLNYQVYVVKTDLQGDTIWTRTYGGPSINYGVDIDVAGDGNLMIAVNAINAQMHSEIALLKVDAVTGDSLWMQHYGSFYSAGIRDATRTADFGYLLAGRANYTGTQDPRVYVMRFNNSSGTAAQTLAKEDLKLDIVTTTSAKDVINISADKVSIYGVSVMIDSLLHPSVGDLEITLEHEGTTVTLIDQPTHSGENFIHTGLVDVGERRVESGYAPYTGWFLPEELMLPFLTHVPTGEWTLTVTDHGTGGIKATTGVLEGWSLNLLTESGSGVGIPSPELLANFGLEQIRPNPLSQEATLAFRIPVPGHVRLSIYNQLGQLVESLVNKELPGGVHETRWFPASLAPGTYFIHLESGGMMSVRKAMLTR